MIKIEDLKKVKLDDDDTLVFQLDHEIYFYSSVSIRESLHRFFRDVEQLFTNKFIVIPSSIKIGIIKESEINTVEEVESVLFNSDNLVGG